MKYFFIIGSAKTGTTLTARILDNHSDIACTTELFPFFVEGGKKKPNRNFMNKMRDHGFTDEFINKTTHQNDVLKWNAAALKSYVKRYLDDFASRCETDIVGDKFIYYIGFFETLYQMFPDAKYIYTVRDPRAVWNSAVKFGIPPKPQVVRMLLYDRAIDHYMARDNFLRLKFEEIAAYPDVYSRVLLDFMGVDPERWNPDLTSTPKYPKRFKKMPNALKSVDKAVINKWKHELDHDTIAKVTKMAMPFIGKYGYSREWNKTS